MVWVMRTFAAVDVWVSSVDISHFEMISLVKRWCVGEAVEVEADPSSSMSVGLKVLLLVGDVLDVSVDTSSIPLVFVE